MHTVSSIATDGVGLLLAKLMPRSVILTPSDIGPLVDARFETTGES